MALIAAILTGCGSHGATSTPTTTAATTTTVQASPHATHVSTPRGPAIVVFKRSLGVDPLSSYYTLYASGAGVATIVYGGRDGAKVHHFALRTTRLRQLSHLLAHTRLRNAAIVDPNMYTYWVITHRGSYRLQQGAIPRSAQPLLGALNAIADENNLF